MKRLVFPTLACMILGLCPAWLEGGDAKLPQRVLYIGQKEKGSRTEEFKQFLGEHFAEVTVARREGFDLALAKNADVVVFDWSQSDSRLRETQIPLGRLEDWDKPTVLLNHAGLLIARQWQLIGGAG